MLNQREIQHLNELFIKKGNLESQLEYLYKQANAAGIVEDLRKRNIDLAAKVERLLLTIAAKRKKQEKRKIEAEKIIEKYAIEILKKDLRYEETFENAYKIDINFDKNTFSVNERNQFSASSTIYLKNCVNYSIFFASLELPFFRYPRFIMCDNMEDKGMQPERSQNFQKLIVEMSESFDVDHQIIFTTSMIDPELNNSQHCIGHEYTTDNKSLSV